MFIEWILAAGLAVLLVVLVARFTKKWTKEDGEPEGPNAAHAGGILSALFLLVFAIAIIVPWTAADTARHNTYAEVQSLNEAYWRAAGLPPADRQAVRAGLVDYTRFVADKEWPGMAAGGELPEGWQRLDAIRVRLTAIPSTNDAVKTARDDTIERLREVYAARRERATEAGAVLPPAVLFFTVTLGLVMLVFPFLAGARPKGMARLPLLVMAAVLGLCVLIVFDLDNVFSGGLAVGSDAYQSAITDFQRIP